MEINAPVCTTCQRWLLHYVRLPPRWSLRRFLVVACLALALLACLISSSRPNSTKSTSDDDSLPKYILRPASAQLGTGNDPVKWLQRNANNAYAYRWETSWVNLLRSRHWSSRPQAAIISLVRNEELDGIMQSMRQLEYHWNHKYQYPWVFFNEQPFSDVFKVKLEVPFEEGLTDVTGCYIKPHESTVLL